MIRDLLLCPSKVRVPISEEKLQRPGDLNFPTLWGYLGVNSRHFGLEMRVCGRFWWDFRDFPPDFYGMKRARVGAFTDFGGFRYRNPVHFLAHFPIFALILGFSGLV